MIKISQEIKNKCFNSNLFMWLLFLFYYCITYMLGNFTSFISLVFLNDV